MSQRREIFRQVSLERLSSPEQLDQLMQVTDPRGWMALAALGALLLVALGWGWYGSVPTEAPGEGILIRRGGVSDLVATGSGQVEQVLASVGQVIRKGQVVARVRQDGLIRQLRDNRSKRADLDVEYRDLERSATLQKRLKAQELEQQRANLTRSIEALGRNLALLEERVAAERKLLDEGLITKQTLVATEQSVNTARDQWNSARLDLHGLDLHRLEAEQQLTQQLETKRGAIRDLDLESRELNAKLAENVEVVSPYAGRVLELLVGRGNVVSPGTPILSVEVVSQELMAVLFVPASLGKQVQRGMEARISPSTVKREEYGYMVGRVVRASEFPSTARGMISLLANEGLVTKLLTEGPLIQVDVALLDNPRTPTGYRWSSSAGPRLKISSGTLTTGSIIVRRDRPLSLVIPGLRAKLGV
ncbi:MAG: NHLP bacteriocin system secretion protein [Acidobacteriota bacterium]|nr:NHLP bacteriocin system secretion protein [Acidobacteriota bacterium]